MISYDFQGSRWIVRDIPYYNEGYKRFPGYATFEPVAGVDVYNDPTVPYKGAYGGGNRYNIDQNRNNEARNNPQDSRYYAQVKLEYNRYFPATITKSVRCFSSTVVSAITTMTLIIAIKE